MLNKNNSILHAVHKAFIIMIIPLCTLIFLCHMTPSHAMQQQFLKPQETRWRDFHAYAKTRTDVRLIFFTLKEIEALGLNPVPLQQYALDAYNMMNDPYLASIDNLPKHTFNTAYASYPYRVAHYDCAPSNWEQDTEGLSLCILHEKSAIRQGLSQLLVIQVLLLPFLVAKLQSRMLFSRTTAYCAYAGSVAFMAYGIYDLWAAPQALFNDQQTTYDNIPVASSQSWTISNRLRSCITLGHRWTMLPQRPQPQRIKAQNTLRSEITSWDEKGVLIPPPDNDPEKSKCVMIPTMSKPFLR